MLPPPTPIRATGALHEIYGTFLEWLKNSGYIEYNLHGDPGTCDYPNQQDHLPNLYVFPYDWTKSNVDNGKLLKNFIQCVSKYYPNKKISIVAHSMGGILARRYILDNLSDHNIDKLITVGTPWLGDPKSIISLETGLVFDDSLIDPITGEILKPVIDRSRGVHQLLPTDTYFQTATVKPFLEQGWDVDLSGNGFRTEIYGYDQLVEMLDKRFLYPPIPLLPGTEGRTFHGPFIDNKGQDDFRVNPTDVTYYHIYGKQSFPSTIGQISSRITVACNNFFICFPKEKFELTKRVDGDGTVPVVSAARNQSLNAPGATVRQFPSAGDPPMEDALLSHTGLMQNEAVYETIIS